MKKAMNQSILTLILNGGSILALLFMMYSLFTYSRVNGQLNEAYKERFDLTYNANRFMNGSSYLTNEVRAFAATGDKKHYDNYWNEINNLKNRDIGVAAMQEIGITADEQAQIDEMSGISNQLVPLEEKAMEEVQEGKNEEAVEYVYGEEYSTSIARINSIKEEFLAALDTRTSANVEVLHKKEDNIRITMIAALILVGIISLVNMIVSRVKILRPVLKIRDQMGEISKGKLSTDFSLTPDTSEIGMLVASIHETKKVLRKYISDIDDKMSQMAEGNMDLGIGNDYLGEFVPIQDAMRQILDALNQALAQINLTAEQVSQESDKMAQGAQSLSSGVTQQAAAVEELTASVGDISEQVTSTSKDADNARQHSEDAAKKLEICDEKMAALKIAMQDISKASDQIGGIIKTIEDISFQTTILALNASVEAARAGDAGKGFAVVADEVQNLANKSSESARDITELIENSIELVRYGVSLSVDTLEALSSVVSSSGESNKMVVQIAASASQQVQSLEQLKQGMGQISEVVQDNASTAERSAASARNLQKHAEELKISVNRFRLRNTPKRR